MPFLHDGFHLGAKAGVLFAIFYQQAVAQQLCYRVRWAAPVEMLALANHDLPIAFRANHDGGLEAGQRNLKCWPNFIAHDGHGGEQRAVAGQFFEDLQAGFGRGDGKWFTHG